MAKKTQTCALDYLLGTLATAYKGLLASLVIRDFCITEEAGTSVVNGTVLSMPEGDYEASLIRSGRELARGGIKDGYFELSVPTAEVEDARNLQLDVIQRGRHIGSFLIKRTERGGTYSSALEILDELKWVDFKTLDDMLGQSKGLRQAGEKIISSVFSSKKDWRKLSGQINRFAKDLFWYNRRAFYMWFGLLSRFSLKAAFLSADSFGDKTVADSLALLELPLGEEEDASKALHAATAWIRELGENPVNLSYRFRQAIDAVTLLSEKLHSADAASVIRRLISSLRDTRLPSLEDKVVDSLGEHAADMLSLGTYSARKGKDILESLTRAEEALSGSGGLSEALEVLGGVDAKAFEEQAMVEAFSDVLEDNLGSIPPGVLSTALEEFFGLFGRVSEGAEGSLLTGSARLFRRAFSEGLPEAAGEMIAIIGGGGERLKEVLLNAETALAVMESGEPWLKDNYREILKGVRIPPPRVAGFSEETWAEIATPLHLKRLQGFMATLRAAGQDGFRDVLLHLVCCLHISGVFIPDDRLFQREVSAFLNSGWPREDFLLSYLLLKKLPVYFGEVGASGRIRDFTTELDAWGNDPVIYFLRKQVHVNASNRNVQLVEEIIRAWVRGDPEGLEGAAPPEVLENLDAEMLKRYSKTIRPFFVSLGVLKDGRLRLDRLIAVSNEELQGRLLELGPDEETASKVLNLCRTYAEVKKKYAFSPERGARAARAAGELALQVEELKKLKETVLSPERTEPVEDLYFKRHIAFGIPSVIGTYREPKFDAYSRGLRVQEAARVLLEETVSEAEEKCRRLLPADLDGWTGVLWHANELFRLNGLENAHVDEVVELLRAGGLRLSQVADVLRIWQRELTWQVESFYRAFHGPVFNALTLYPPDELPERLRRLGPGEEGFLDRAADIVVKDIINTVAGFEELDRLLNAVIKAINYQVETGEDVYAGERERPEKGFYVLDEIDAGEAARLAPVLGSKAGNLMRLIKEGIPVPPAAVFLSSRTWESEGYIESGEFVATLRAAVEAIQRRSGLGFGRMRDPLFLSVRSGSYISMPGILDSVLYCGMNDATCAALQRSTKDPWLAWDSRRRFIEHYAAVVLGMKSALLEGVLSGVLKDRGAGEPRELDAEALKEAAGGYLRVLSDNGHYIPDGPYEQLKAAVLAVYRSWYGERAVQFRRAMGVSEHWGTAVTVMRMVYANRRGAGSSVFFTRDPLTLAPGVYGETKETATGDDLVSGRAPGVPMSRSQGGGSLEVEDPELFGLHLETARRVEEAMGGLPQEVEAAYEKREGVVYVLQTKRMELRRSRGEKFHDACRMESNRIGRGIGVHGGPLTGVATFARSAWEVRELREKLNEPLILIRKETSTDDVALMSEVEGILTAVGGASSHAAILAQKFDLDAVVGCPEMEVARGDGGPYARIGEYTVMEGSPVSIDGSNGLVYSGLCAFMIRDEEG